MPGRADQPHRFLRAGIPGIGPLIRPCPGVGIHHVRVDPRRPPSAGRPSGYPQSSDEDRQAPRSTCTSLRLFPSCRGPPGFDPRPSPSSPVQQSALFKRSSRRGCGRTTRCSRGSARSRIHVGVDRGASRCWHSRECSQSQRRGRCRQQRLPRSWGGERSGHRDRARGCRMPCRSHRRCRRKSSVRRRWLSL